MPNHFRLSELLPCPAYDPDALDVIEEALLAARATGNNSTAYLELDSNSQPLLATRPDLLEPFWEIASKIREYQTGRNGLIGKLTMHAAIVPFQIEPQWHAETFNDAFVTTTVAATEGLSGTISGDSQEEAERTLLELAKTDPEFVTLPGVSVVRPPLHSLLHLTYGAFHRSPVPTDATPDEKLIVNANMMPNFM